MVVDHQARHATSAGRAIRVGAATWFALNGHQYLAQVSARFPGLYSNAVLYCGLIPSHWHTCFPLYLHRQPLSCCTWPNYTRAIT